jgi:2-aminoadipate transaminase
LQPLLLINAKQAMDTCTNLPAQRLLTGFLVGGHLDNHLVTQRAEYKRRNEAMRGAARALATSRGGPTPRAASSAG